MSKSKIALELALKATPNLYPPFTDAIFNLTRAKKKSSEGLKKLDEQQMGEAIIRDIFGHEAVAELYAYLLAEGASQGHKQNGLDYKFADGYNKEGASDNLEALGKNPELPNEHGDN